MYRSLPLLALALTACSTSLEPEVRYTEQRSFSSLELEYPSNELCNSLADWTPDSESRYVLAGLTILMLTQDGIYSWSTAVGAKPVLAEPGSYNLGSYCELVIQDGIIIDIRSI